MILAVWKTMCMLAPWMLLGTAIAGLIHVWLPANFLRQSLRGRWGVIKAVMLGVPLPLCSCGVIPTGIGLRKNGASSGASVGFMISTPQTGVDSVLVAASFLGWPFAIFKILAAGVTGIAGGFLTDSLVQESEPETAELTDGPARRGFRDFVDHSLEILRSIWIWLVVGVIISAAITEWVPPTAFEELNGWGLLPALLLVLLISTPLYVCATASVPIAAALVQSGLPPAVALVFLMAGPATNIATMTSIFGKFGFRTTAIYLTTIVAGSIGFAYLFDWVITLPSTDGHGHVHEHPIRWWEHVCAAVLTGIFIGFAIMGLRKKILTGQQSDNSNPDWTFVVSGMHCDGCASTLEKALRKQGADKLLVDYRSGKVQGWGSVDASDIQKAIAHAGYELVESDDAENKKM